MPDQKEQSRKRLGDRRFGAVLFVLTTIVLWFVFGSLAQIVITCIPGATRCLLADDWRRWFVGNGTDAISRRDTLLMLISLAIAAWAAVRIFFPAEDFDDLA